MTSILSRWCTMTDALRLKMETKKTLEKLLDIMSKSRVVPMRSLKADNPVLAAEWSVKNGSLKPDEVSYGSSKKVWWKGKCGHEWQATVKNRNIRGSGCPYCSGNKVMK